MREPRLRLENRENPSIRILELGSTELNEYYKWNNEHRDVAEKKSFVYLDDKGKSLPFKDEHEMSFWVQKYHEYAVGLKGKFLGERVKREAEGKVLDYVVIDGEKIKEHFPDIWLLFLERMRILAEQLFGGSLVPLHDKAAVNINIVPPGGEQGFHRDRNEVTFIIFLSSNRGGELEIESGSTLESIPARRGTVVGLVKANEITHRVKVVEEMSVEFGKERVALVLGYGLPEKNYEEPERDDFLYAGNIEVKEQKVFDSKK